MGLLINIDNGGTFTDICILDEHRVVRAKTLTTPYDLTKCFIDVLRSGSKELYREENVGRLLQETDYIRYSTTAGTNAIVQKKGPRLGLILENGADPSFLLDGDAEKDMFQAMVSGRVEHVDPKDSTSVVRAVNALLSEGSNRLVVSLTEEEEKNVKRIVLEKYPRHLLGAVPVLFSYELVDDPNETRRTWSALINAFLHPVMERFLYNAENFLRTHRTKNPMLIFHNDGNSTRVAKTTAIKTYGSGPQGGMEGALALSRHYGLKNLVTMDIGGTTTDIGIVQNGVARRKKWGQVEGIETSFALSDLVSIGAGGSSVFRVKGGRITVGPDSVGAAPGPACFVRGGQEATITDAYLLMGILDSNSYFGGNMALDEQRAQTAILENVARPLGVSLEKALLEMENAYAEKIAEVLTAYTNEISGPWLLAFGGAGPMSACAVAERAGIQNVLIPRLAAVFSAFGISFSDIAHEYEANLEDTSSFAVEDLLAKLQERAKRDMFAEGFHASECNITHEIQEGDTNRLHLRIVHPIAHFFFAESSHLPETTPQEARRQWVLQSTGDGAEIPVYRFEDMVPGTVASGPALIEDELFTCRVLSGWTFWVNENKDIFLRDERGI